jgi:hypothetical protein
VVYQLTRPSATCRYSVLAMTHRAGADADIGWNAVGYPSPDSVSQQRREEGLGCYLYRPTVGK